MGAELEEEEQEPSGGPGGAIRSPHGYGNKCTHLVVGEGWGEGSLPVNDAVGLEGEREPAVWFSLWLLFLSPCSHLAQALLQTHLEEEGPRSP